MADAPKIHTIPMEFYGGKNPAPPEIAVTPAAPVAPTTSINPKLPPQVVVPAIATKSSAKPNSSAVVSAAVGNKSLVVILSIVGIVVLLGGGAGAYWYFFLRTVPTPLVVTVPTITLAETSTTTPEVATTSTPEITTSTPVAVLSPIPAHTFFDTVDSDNDGLTDVEEELWGTDSAKNDSDGDGFSDQTELFNLYNPAGVAPQKLIAAQLISVYTSASYNFSVYYPAAWVARALDATTGKEVLFSGLTEEYFDIMVFPYPTEPLPDWFAKTFPDEILSTYTPFKNKMGVAGLQSADNLVALVSDGTNVFLLTYHGGTRTDINFRSTFRLLVESFKPNGAGAPLMLPLTTPTTTLSSGVTSTPEFVGTVTTTPIIENATSTLSTTSSTP